MSEKHQKTTVTSVADVMAAIFNTVQTGWAADVSSGPIRWADTASTGTTTAAYGLRGIWSGVTSAFVTAAYAAANTAIWANATTYMVIESSATMGGQVAGFRWQVKISRGAANANLYVNFAPRGGWVSGTQTFPAATTNVISTGNLDSFGNVAMSVSNRILISMSDLDTYGSGVTYSYLRVLLWDGFNATINRGFYVGGYIPFDQTNNLNPAVCLIRSPTLIVGTGSWSYNLVGGFNRISPEYAGTTLNLAAAGYACIKAVDYTLVNRDPAGNWVNFPVYIWCVDDSSFFGYFGKYTMFGGGTGRALCTADGTGQYLSVNELVMRWNPTA